MTQKAHWRYLIGVRGAGGKNQRGRIIPVPNAFTQLKVTPGGRPLERAYGGWHIHNNPVPRLAPGLVKTDSDAPSIAYYLHLCLPFRHAAGHDGFNAFTPALRQTGRMLFLQLCWLIMEIACLATLLNEGTVTKRGDKRSHGLHQHKGVLDVYVSYFFWRVMQFEFALAVNGTYGLDFIQWHQKYFADARNCPALDIERLTTIGRQMYGSTDIPARSLVARICNNLCTFYQGDIRFLVMHACGRAGVPREVGQYFMHPRLITALQDRSAEVRPRLAHV
jgi:hypothetical protein